MYKYCNPCNELPFILVQCQKSAVNFSLTAVSAYIDFGTTVRFVGDDYL